MKVSMSLQRSVLVGWLLAMLVAVQGCGFHLKGHGNVGASAIDSIAIYFAPAVQGALKKAIVKNLQQRGVAISEVTESEMSAAMGLLVIENTNLRVLQSTAATVSSNVSESIKWVQPWSLKQNQTLVLSDTTTLYRDRQIDPAALLAAEQEKLLLIDGLANEIAGQIVRRVNVYYERQKAKSSKNSPEVKS